VTDETGALVPGAAVTIIHALNGADGRLDDRRAGRLSRRRVAAR
jgi:hypothetical protein